MENLCIVQKVPSDENFHLKNYCFENDDDFKLRNSPLSMIESKEDQIIFESISIRKGQKSDYLMVDYPFKHHYPQLYHPSKSNIHLAEKTTATLFILEKL